MTHVSKIITGENLRSSIAEAVGEFGGFGSIVEPGDSVLLKPNYNSADPFPASTDLEFLRCLVQLVLEQGPERVIIGESSAFNVSTSKIMDKVGVRELEALSPEVEVIDLDKSDWVQKKNPRAKYLRKVRLPGILDRVDKIVLLPCLKTHFLAEFSGSLKLSVAFMRPRERIALHFRNLQPKIAELNSYIHPNIVVMDARKCFINGGPYKGEVRASNLIMCSTDRIAIDVEGIRVIQNYPGNSLAGDDPLEIPHIKMALAIGIDQVSAVGEPSASIGAAD